MIVFINQADLKIDSMISNKIELNWLNRTGANRYLEAISQPIQIN